MTNQSHRNHYVPQWYQRRFLPSGHVTFKYLDMAPEVVATANGGQFTRRALLPWGPARCFCQDDLYTFKLGKWSTDEIERRFFGPIDSEGRDAVEFFSDFSFEDGIHEAYQDLVRYMDAQRLRTPRGLDWIKSFSDARNHNVTLLRMQQVFQLHATMWTEGVWEIASAHNSPTKFLLTDSPVTFFNPKVFPGSPECAYPGDVALDKIGTRTIFPLDLETCLIITHVQLVRDPWSNMARSRINARSFAPCMANLLDIQFGRELEEDDVLRINLILKRRATRYIAAVEPAWLYPERSGAGEHWSNIDDDWFLLPHLYKVPFGGGVAVGYKNGSSWAVDEYGYDRSHPRYDDKRRRDTEWATHLKAKLAWAVKRAGKSTAKVHESRFCAAGDAIMTEELEEHRARRQH